MEQERTYSLQFGRQGKSCFEDFCIISVTNKKTSFRPQNHSGWRKTNEKNPTTSFNSPPEKKNFEILSPNSYTRGKPPWVFSTKNPVRLEFPILSVLKLAPLFRGAFRFFPATGILPNPSATSWTLWRARSRRLACIFATKGILGRKFPWEMWVEKVNIDIADIHNLATYLYDLFLNTTATECRVYLPTMKG